MSRVKLGRGPQWAQIDGGQSLAQSLAVHLAQAGGIDKRWRFDIQARTPDGGVSYVGSVVTAPFGSGGPVGARVVALAACPGAIGWVVRAELANPGLSADDRDAAWLTLSTSTELGSLCCGVTPVHGSVAESEGVYEHFAGTGPAVVALPVGARLVRWSISAVGADATIAISEPSGVGVETTVTVRAGQIFTDEPTNLAGLRTFTLAGGADTWFFAWRRE
jgi:hypothetical protein